MQTSSGPREDSSIFPLILACLLALLAWNLFLVSTSILRLVSIHAASKSREKCEEAASNYLEARSAPWNRRNQLLAKASVEKRVVLRSSKIDPSLPKRLLGQTCRDIREFAPKNFPNNFQLSTKTRDGSPGDVIEANIRNDADKIPHENRRSSMNSSVATIEEVSNVEERSSRDEVESCAMSGTKFVDRVEEKFEQSTMKSLREGRYAKDGGLDREKRDTSRKNTEVPSSDELGAHLEIETDREICQGRSANLETKIEERPETTVSRSMAEKFLASILRESSGFGANSKELLDEGTIDFGAPNEVTRSTGKHVTEVEENRDAGSRRVERLEEFVSRAQQEDKDNEICEARKQGDYPTEQFGVVPEKGANCTEEESVGHSSKNATQSRTSGEEEEEVGAPPATTTSLKNGPRTESTIFLGQPAAARRGKEEDDLNAIIRKMIIMELKRHRKKEQATLKRAHSDTESVLPRKKHNVGDRAGLFNVKGRTFFRDLLELEEDLRRGIENESDGESIEVKIDERIAERKDSVRQDANSRTDVKVDGRIVESISSTATTCKADSNIRLERKVNARCLRDANRSIEHGKASAIHQPNKSTQTEHVYVIRAVRSCPLRKRRLPVQFQVHRLASSRDAVSSKTVFASLDLSRFVFRKASDNLIYEKGKASRSPSYIPVPERCRWKYVTPRKSK